MCLLIPTVTLTSRAAQVGAGILRKKFGTKSNVDWVSFEHAQLPSGQWTVDSGMWIVDSGMWTVECGQWNVDSWHWAVYSGK
jgi:hypothetical protein